MVNAPQVDSVLIAPEKETLVSQTVDSLVLDFGGCVGDRHYGAVRPSNSRHALYYPRGTQIRNRRQVTIIGTDELEHIAELIGVPEVRAEWLGANMTVTGLPHLSATPEGSRMLFSSGVGLICEGANHPCRHPGTVIASEYPDVPRIVSAFVKKARGWRGIVATVERPGVVKAGDRVTVVEPERYNSPIPVAPEGFTPISDEECRSISEEETL